MSRLESFIRRMSAQRDLLNEAACRIAEIDGPVVELGLGNGRTFDHLRTLFPQRRILVFDRKMSAFAASRPAPEDFVEGDIRERAAAFAGIGAALVHCDIATGYAEADDATIAWLAGVVAPLLRPGGFAVSGIPLEHDELEALALPPGVAEGRYFFYRRR